MKQPFLFVVCLIVVVLGSDLESIAQLPATNPTAATQPASAPRATIANVIAPASSVHSSSDLTALSLEDLMNVEVTSVSKTKERIYDAPASVTSIGPEDIQRSGLHEIPEILRLAPGLFVQRGDQLTKWSVGSRGFSDAFANKLLVLQDGRELYEPFFAGVYWNMVDYPIADLDRIEVIRGPGATLWGSNAVNGVINIMSKPASETQGVLVDSRLGIESSDLALRYGGKIDDRTYYRAYIKGRTFRDEPAVGGGFANDQLQDTHGGFRIDRQATDKDTLTLQIDSGYQSVSNNMLPDGIPVAGYAHDYISDADILARWTHVDSAASDSSLQFYYDRFSTRDPALDHLLNTYDFEYQQRFLLTQRNEFIYGLGARFQQDNVGTIVLSQPIVSPASQTTSVYSGFLQDSVALVPDRLRFIIGSKLEHNSYTGFEVQPSARLLWTPGDSTSLWGAISRAVRVPSRFDENANLIAPIPSATPTFLTLSGDPGNIKAEQEISYELGLRQAFGKTVTLDVTGFINHYNDLTFPEALPPVFVPTPVPHVLIPSHWANTQSALTYGTEISANWRVLDNWRLSGSYSLLIADVHNDISTVPAAAAGAIGNSFPRNQFQLHSYLDVTSSLQFNTSLYYEGGIGPGGSLALDTGPNVSGYTRTDFSLAWTPKPGLTVSAGVQNAFAQHHTESTTGMGSNAQVSRDFYAQFNWRF